MCAISMPNTLLIARIVPFRLSKTICRHQLTTALILLLPRADSSRCSIEGKNLLLQQRGTACRNLGGVGEGRDEKAVLGPPL